MPVIKEVADYTNAKLFQHKTFQAQSQSAHNGMA